MRRSYLVGAATLALSAMLGSAPVQAQTTVGWDASLFSSYVWRGLSLTNKPVLQPDLYVTFPLGPTSLTAGGWANIDLGKYDGSSDISESGAESAFNLAEFDWWGELAIPVGPVFTITPGVTGYIYPNDLGLTKDNNTVEVYGKLALSTFLSPKLNIYYDVDKIKGAYIEASVSQGFPLTPALPLTLGALAGFSAGQEVNTSDPNELANFNESGLTHIDLSLSLPFSAGPLSIAPAFHFVINNDEFVKVTKAQSAAPGFNQADTKIWGGVTISWSHDFGGSEEAAE